MFDRKLAQQQRDDGMPMGEIARRHKISQSWLYRVLSSHPVRILPNSHNGRHSVGLNKSAGVSERGIPAILEDLRAQESFYKLRLEQVQRAIESLESPITNH